MNNVIRPLYFFKVLQILLWGAAIAILGQQFHHFFYLKFVNYTIFGWIMIVFSLIAGYNFYCPILWKNLNKKIVYGFLLFCFFHLSFITASYLLNKPIDAAWARNLVEGLVILWMLFEIKE